jgi:hypothetical protein
MKIVAMNGNCKGKNGNTHIMVTADWIQRVARNMHTEVIGEMYASQGALLRTQLTGKFLVGSD